jgi:hypothetical protein
VTITPLGVPVDPDVYWRKAKESMFVADGCHSEARLLLMSSVVIKGKVANSE